MTVTSRLRSILRWVRAGYPDGAPGPDRVPLLALLRSAPLTDRQLDDVVRAITANRREPIERDQIAMAVEDVTHRDACPEDIEAVAVKLAAAGLSVVGAILRE